MGAVLVSVSGVKGHPANLDIAKRTRFSVRNIRRFSTHFGKSAARVKWPSAVQKWKLTRRQIEKLEEQNVKESEAAAAFYDKYN